MTDHPAAAGAGSRPDPLPGAEEAGLRWWSDEEPAIERRRAGRGFTYRRPDGRRLDDRAAMARIRALAIPPAWTDVRICPDPRGHLQATGRDARGRKQYRYHQRWRETRDAAKFGRLVEFGEALPRIRARVGADLDRPGLPREKVLALVVRLLEMTLVRVGNDEYARLNRSFGLTTLQNRHARAAGTGLRLRFRGKAGRVHEIGIRDRRISRLVRRCRELPGRDLFEYVGEGGEIGVVRSEDVNAYLREAAGADVTARMFRTWAATVLAADALRGASAAGGTQAPERARSPDGPVSSSRGRSRDRAIGPAMRAVAERLGNTPAVARRSYVHPAVIDAYRDGSIAEVDAGSHANAGDHGPAGAPPDGDGGVLPDREADATAGGDGGVLPGREATVLALLRRSAD